MSAWRCGSMTVFERRANHVEIVRVATRDEPGEIGGLPDEIGQLHGALENGARLLGGQEHVRMQDHRPHIGRDGICLTRGWSIPRSAPTAEQGRRDVVHMQRAARHRFACIANLSSSSFAARLSEQCIGRDEAPRRRPPTAETGAQGNALVNFEREAKRQLQGLLHGEQSLACVLVSDPWGARPQCP